MKNFIDILEEHYFPKKVKKDVEKLVGSIDARAFNYRKEACLLFICNFSEELEQLFKHKLK